MFSRCSALLIAVCLAVGLCLVAGRPTAQATAAPPENGYEKTVKPFFAAYCFRCHEGEKAKGDLRLDAQLPNNFNDAGIRHKWLEVVNVLNSHSMPPKAAKQPPAKDVAAVVDWITAETIKAELARRESAVVLRRLNREEYRNTIRDLTGVDFDVSVFPQDPPGGGFDNNGAALSLSPLHVETYLGAARQVLDRALVEGERPRTVRWRFTPKVGDIDRTRVRLDEANRFVIVNGGRNRQEGKWVVVHTNGWDKPVSARNFRVPTAGDYLIRISAAGKVPSRAEVVKSAEGFLKKRRDDQDRKNPKGAKWTAEQYQRDLEHFRTDRMYDYGPPRVKLVLQLGPQPRTIAEFDADGTPERPRVHEIRARFTTESAGVNIENAYSLPRELENFWMQGHEQFARPDLYVEWFEIEGPIFDAWPPSSHTGILFDSPLRKTDERQYAAEVLARFMRRAYRRPVTAGEVDAKLRHYDAARKEGDSFVQAIKRPLAAVLVSPHFLYLAEPVEEGKGLKKLDAHALAARLSYFLWSTMPDDELAKCADEGKLSAPEVLAKQVQRMLQSPRSDALVRNFAGQWLGLREVGSNPPAPDLFPRYDRHLETSIVAESEGFFREILRNDLDVRNFIKSDFVVINERLARFYGIPGVKGDHFRKVTVPAGVQRGGVLTQASVLTITSNGTRTSPVKRGTWTMKNLLGTDPGLPVANAGEIAPKVPGINKATVRKRLEIHRTLDQCARCHNRIDPLGFALENFNAAGEWREREGFGYKGRIGRDDPLIDASGEMPDGTKFVGVAGLQDVLLKQEDLFLSCLASKMYQYALGRELGLADRPTVKRLVADMKKDGRSLTALVQAIVRTPEFRSK